jgi:hydroxymethylbilane synthase
MPAVLPDGLVIAGVLPREDPHDAIVMPPGTPLQTPGRGQGTPAADATGTTAASQPGDIEALIAALGQTPSIGTSSVRRIAQLSRLLPGARFAPIRGNLDTRLRKLDSGEHDAIVLAAAGLRRLGFASRISLRLPISACVPAPGQGIIAIEIREGDPRVTAAVERITDRLAGAALTAERAVVEALGGGCQTPIGALASPVNGDQLDLVAVVVALDGSRAVRASARGRQASAAELGSSVAQQLVADGAADILDESRRVPGAVEGIQP